MTTIRLFPEWRGVEPKPGQWEFDFMLRPEQSVPFAVGKVEVRTKPFDQ